MGEPLDLTSNFRNGGKSIGSPYLTCQTEVDGKILGMEPLALDSGDYSGSYKLIGGRVCLDLVNTISWPGTQRQHDWLNTPANVIAWLEAVGLQTIEITAAELSQVHQIRRVVADLLRPLAHGTKPPTAAVERFNQRLTRTLVRRLIDPVHLRWAWRSSQEDRGLLDPVVLDTAQLATAGDHSRLKHCPSCDWIFEDQTRNGQRRWCDMADCGSRAKARSYYRRKNLHHRQADS